MEVGTAVHAGELKLPGGITLNVDPETLVLHVIARQAAEEPEGAAEGAAPEAPEALAETTEGGGQEQAG
jgi:large subunit ribosomal protein L25